MCKAKIEILHFTVQTCLSVNTVKNVKSFTCKVLEKTLMTTPDSLTKLKYCTSLWIQTFKNYFRMKIMARTSR